MNRRKQRNNTSGFKGVRAKGRRWMAEIQAGGVYEYLGRFDTPKEAAEAYDAASVRLHGEYGIRNFSTSGGTTC
jgi:hypothetical protein